MNARIRISKGLDIPIAGHPEQSVHAGPPIRQVALNGLDYHGLKPRVLVAPGDEVELGQALFIDKRDPEVRYGSPGRGTVIAVNRGPRRVLETIVVRLHEDGPSGPRFAALDDSRIRRLDSAAAAARLLESGLWPAFRTRPFNQVPKSASTPRSIFVTATDTRPLTADPRVIIRPETAAFVSGLQVLARLTAGAVHLCTGPDWDIPLPEIERLRVTEFSGPHPAGLVGTHIHCLDPVGPGRMVWHIGYQDVIAIGKLFTTGEIPTGRIVALAGKRVIRPRLIATRMGASTDNLVAGELEDPASCRVIAGSVLNGRTATGSNAFLGRYHQQLSIIREGGRKSLFGWLDAASRRYMAAATFLKQTGHRRKFAFTTSQNGRFSGMLPLRVFEKLMPLDILPSPLFRALLVRDTDQAQALGCLELAEEDLALCSFVCPAKYDYGAILRLNLDQIEKEG